MRAAAILTILVLAIAAFRAAAQEPADTIRVTLGDRAPKPAGARTITGIVVDTSGAGVDSVDVYIADVRRHTSSGAEGRFRFDDLRPGTYKVAARRFGFYPQVLSVVVGPSGGTATFVLLPMGHRLPPIVSSSSRGGLSGVVGDTAYNVIRGAEVEIVAGAGRALSDSSGSFFIAAKPGRYMVRIRREGYATRMLGVTIPKDSGRRILAWMMPASRPPTALEKVAQFELEQRLMRASTVWSKLYTREDINTMRIKDVVDLATIGAGRRIDPGCEVLLDGGPRRAQLWGLSVDDVETMEVHARRPQRNAPRSIVPGGTRQPQNLGAGPDCPATIYVWLRK